MLNKKSELISKCCHGNKGFFCRITNPTIDFNDLPSYGGKFYQYLTVATTIISFYIDMFNIGPCIGFAICGCIQNLVCGQRLKSFFAWGQCLKKCDRQRILPTSIYGYTAIVGPILNLQLTAQTQKLRYEKKLLKYRPSL